MLSFEQLLDPRELTPAWRGTQSLSEYFFTDRYFTNPRNVNTDDVQLISISGITQPGPGNVRNGSARVLTPQGGTKRHASLFRYFVEMELQADALKALQSLESLEIQEKGAEVVELANEEMAIKHSMFKEVVISQIFNYGRVNLNANGELLAPSVNATTGALTDASGTTISADFAVPNGHRGNLGGTIAAQWSTAGTKISEHLESLRRQATIAGVPRPTEIIVNGISKKHLRNNTEFQTWAKESNQAPDTILRGDMIEGLWGYNWHFVDGTWTDVDGTTHDLVHQNFAIILPSQGPWLRTYNGSELVPMEIGLSPDVATSLANLKKIYGQFVYSQLKHNPARLSLFYGDNFGLGFGDPNSIWIAKAFT